MSKKRKKLKRKKKVTKQSPAYPAETIASSARMTFEPLDENTKLIISSVLFVLLLHFLWRSRDVSHSSFTKVTPPPLGEFALYMILSKNDRQYVIGDLAEEYAEVLAKFGELKASIWYYKQVFTSAWPLTLKCLRVSILAWAEEWIRRRI